MTSTITNKQGSRVGILLFHGLLGSSIELRFVANGLRRQGYVVSCPEIAGYSSTVPAAAKTNSWKDWYKSAEGAFDALRESCDTVIVGGHSTGAMLALLLAANRGKEVSGLALFAPTLWLTGWGIPWYARLFRLVTNRKLADCFSFPALPGSGIKDARVREFVMKSVSASNAAPSKFKAPGSMVLERRWLVDEVLRKLHLVSQPALILHSREDDYAGLDNALFLQRKLGGTVETVILDDCYHFVTVDRQRDTVTNSAIDFTARVVARTGAVNPARSEPVRRLALAASAG